MNMETAKPRVAARVVIASIAGVWLCYFVLATLRAAIVGFEFTLPMLSRRLVVTVVPRCRVWV